MASRYIPFKLRQKVLNRDKGICFYCKEVVAVQSTNKIWGCSKSRWLHIDHKNPLSNGGKNALSNLVTSCMKCNTRKSKKASQV